MATMYRSQSKFVSNLKRFIPMAKQELEVVDSVAAGPDTGAGGTWAGVGHR